jgi:alpha-glucuronidase
LIASNGQPEALIVVGDSASPFDRFVAGELQRYVEMLSGAKLEVILSRQVSGQAKGRSLLLVGGPESNGLVRQAANHRQVNFEGLKPEGYILRRLSLEGCPSLVVGGNDEAGTMYAAYDLLERLGFVFLLTKDILPEKRAEVALPFLDERGSRPSRDAACTWTTPIPTRRCGRWTIGEGPSTRWPKCA